MSYSIEFSQRAVKDLKKLEKSVQENILNALERISVRPYDFVRRLKTSKYFRLKVNEYRVIIDIQNDKLMILVVTLGHRRNIYKKF